MRLRGFTLVEVMIVVAILGIIASIAFPSYRNYVLRGNRTAAKTVLTEVASAQENFMTDRKRYATTLVEAGFPGNTFVINRQGMKWAAAPAGEPIVYQFSMVTTPAGSPTPTGFTVTATTQGGQTRDRCTTLTLNNLGTKAGTPAAYARDCWNK